MDMAGPAAQHAAASLRRGRHRSPALVVVVALPAHSRGQTLVEIQAKLESTRSKLDHVTGARAAS